MADTAAADAASVREAITTVGNPDPKRRDFLKLVTGSAAVAGKPSVRVPSARGWVVRMPS